MNASPNLDGVRWMQLCKLQLQRKSISSPEEPTALDMLLITLHVSPAGLKILLCNCVIVTCNWLAQKYKKENQQAVFKQKPKLRNNTKPWDHDTRHLCRQYLHVNVQNRDIQDEILHNLTSHVSYALSRYPLSSKQADWLPYCRVGWQWLGVTSVLYIGLFFAFVLVKERFHSSLCCVYVTRGCGQIKARRIKGFVDNKMPWNMYLVESLRLSFTENQTQPDRHEAPRQEQ